jgi:MULE transposase domain
LFFFECSIIFLFILIGLPKDEWINAAEVLQSYAEKNSNNTIKVIHDEHDVITHIFIQLSIQKDLYKKFGHLVQYDGTHRTNKCGMPLYTLLIEDNYGVGQPVWYCFMREETTDSIKLALETFAQVIFLHFHVVFFLSLINFCLSQIVIQSF